MNTWQTILAALFIVFGVGLFGFRLVRALLHAQALIQNSKQSGGEL